MLGEDLLKEYIELADKVSSISERDIPIGNSLAFVRVKRNNTKIIFLESGIQIRIPTNWILFFSGLADWGFDKIPNGFIKDMAELCYGIYSTSIVDIMSVRKLFSLNTKEFRDWAEERGLIFKPIEVITPDIVKEI